MAERISNLAQQLRPYWLRDVAAGTVTAGTSTGLTAHELSGPYHTGTLLESQAPWAATKSQISGLAGAGLTYDGVALNVGAGSGITVNAADVALTTPGTLTVSTSNSATGNHTHAITASADVTAGTSALLKSASGNLKLATGNIGSTLQSNAAFTSGFAGAGWNIDYGSTEAGKASATFDNLTVRGRMRVYELLIQQIRATNGSVLVSSSSKILTVSAESDPTWTVNGATLQFNGADATLTTTIYTIATSTSTEAGASRTHYHGFLVGDLIRAQQMEWDGSGFAGVIQSDLEVTAVANLYSYTAARVSTASDAPAVGYDFVRIGSASNANRQGVVYLTSDDDNAPFIDIVDGVAAHSDWNTPGKIRARLGRLDGITDAQWGTLDGYGLWSDNVYLTGNIYATDGIFNGTVYATDGIFSGTVYASAGTFTGAITANSGSIDGFLTIGTSGGIYQGTGTAASPTTGLKIWNDSGVGRIGGYNGGDLQWTANTTGRFYAGYMSSSSTTDKHALRLARDGVRLVAEASGSYAVSTSASAIRWIYNSTGDVDTAIGSGETYTALYSYNNTTSNTIYTGLMTFVGDAVYTTKDSTVYLTAQHWTGTTTKAVDFILTTYKSTGNTVAYCNADRFYLTKALQFDEMTAPSAPSANGVFIYAEDNGSGKTRLMALFSSGAAQQIAIQP